MSHPGLTQTTVGMLAALHLQHGILGLAWGLSNPNPGSQTALTHSTRVPQEGTMPQQGVQTGAGAVHQ